MGSLRELQKLDRRISEIRSRIRDFDPLLAEVEEPALRLEDEHGKASTRLEQMKTDARRLERSAEDKQARAEKLDERLSQVTNLREETAVKTELEMVQRSIDADEQEAMQLLEQVRQNELLVDELQEQSATARAEVLPRQEELLDERSGLDESLAELSARRDTVLEMLGTRERQVYESFHGSGRAVVVAALTEDGACGHCFGIVPLQQQNEIRRDEGLHRCEACGVILTSEPEEEPDPVPVAPIESEESEESEESDESAEPDDAEASEASVDS
ncbi:MAG: hypothetical protein EA351_11585 [Gemmatimonadales bacterium]|nr:MAG: hypothetical protein EA351_11585 [Gemmatimonadales bacterium]